MKDKLDSNTILLGNLDVLFSIMDRSSGQKIDKDIADLNDIGPTGPIRHIEHSI